MENNIEEIEKKFEEIRGLLKELNALILIDILGKVPDSFYEGKAIKVEPEERILCKSMMKNINLKES